MKAEGVEEEVLELGGLDIERVGFGRDRHFPDAGGSPHADGLFCCINCGDGGVVEVVIDGGGRC